VDAAQAVAVDGGTELPRQRALPASAGALRARASERSGPEASVAPATELAWGFKAGFDRDCQCQAHWQWAVRRGSIESRRSASRYHDRQAPRRRQ
jgi:hypothetical protein